VARLLRDLRRGDAQVVDDFWQEVQAEGTPLVEAVDDGTALVTFLWRGEATYTGTAWLDVTLSRIDGTDLWYGSQRLPLDLRTLYYFRHVDGGYRFPSDPGGVGPFHLDPLNPRPVRLPADPNDPADYAAWLSLLELPAAPEEQWSQPLPGVARGSMLTTSISTAALGGRRRINVYRPAGRPQGPVALLVVFDGFASRTMLRIPTTLDNLIAAGHIPPTMALFITAPGGKRRDRELRPGSGIGNFVLRELIPWARHRWRISDDPQNRVIAGASLGGLAASYIGMVAPEEFGCVLSQSGSYWWPAPSDGEPEWLTRAFASRPLLPLRFYLDIGDRETLPTTGEGLEMLTVNRRFRDVLVERGYPVTYTEYSGAHDYINWRRTFADGLMALLGDPASRR
jgi:enterochelin esterase family protein